MDETASDISYVFCINLMFVFSQESLQPVEGLFSENYVYVLHDSSIKNINESKRGINVTVKLKRKSKV